MSTISSADMSNLVAARRLMEIARKEEARRNGKKVEEMSALDYMEEDQALISDSAKEAQMQAANSTAQIENVNIKLADIRRTTKQAVTPADNGFTIEANQRLEIKLELRYRSNAPIDGLMVHDQNYAESDRYLFKFTDGSTFTILDKWSNKSTTIWGDPHVDVSDVEGASDGDFKDLKTSDEFTTFMLGDGTRVTFKAKDAGIIERVDIFKGSDHVKGFGQAAKDFSPENGLFFKQVLSDGKIIANATTLGDVIRSGGDGNDWFDTNNNLIWGKTTGPVIMQRPPATLEFYYKQTVSSSISVQTLNRDA